LLFIRITDPPFVNFDPIRDIDSRLARGHHLAGILTVRFDAGTSALSARTRKLSGL
jgi:hypothetical protein